MTIQPIKESASFVEKVWVLLRNNCMQSSLFMYIHISPGFLFPVIITAEGHRERSVGMDGAENTGLSMVPAMLCNHVPPWHFQPVSHQRRVLLLYFE